VTSMKGGSRRSREPTSGPRSLPSAGGNLNEGRLPKEPRKLAAWLEAQPRGTSMKGGSRRSREGLRRPPARSASFDLNEGRLPKEPRRLYVKEHFYLQLYHTLASAASVCLTKSLALASHSEYTLSDLVECLRALARVSPFTGALATSHASHIGTIERSPSSLACQEVVPGNHFTHVSHRAFTQVAQSTTACANTLLFRNTRRPLWTM